jgi:hypothetical protein
MSNENFKQQSLTPKLQHTPKISRTIFQTPLKNNHSIQTGYTQGRDNLKFFDILSSEKINRTGNFTSGKKCSILDCQMCPSADALSSFTMSPSTNFCYHSPGSLEKYLESFSRERINVLKLLKKDDGRGGEGNKFSIKNENKENSNPNSAKKSSESDLEPNLVLYENLDKLAKSFFTNNNNLNVNLKKSVNKKDTNTKKNLMNLFEINKSEVIVHNYPLNNNLINRKTNRTEKKEDFYKNQNYDEDIIEENLNYDRKLSTSQSFKDLILNSPPRIPSKSRSDTTATNISTAREERGSVYDEKTENLENESGIKFNNQKRNILFTSDKKSFTTNSITVSDKKLNTTESLVFESSAVKSSYAPTFFSTEKKTKKRFRKNSEQLKTLNETYEEFCNKEWTKEIILELSTKIGLSQNKIYKWFWDKKNKELLNEKDKKVFFIKSDKKRESANKIRQEVCKDLIENGKINFDEVEEMLNLVDEN